MAKNERDRSDTIVSAASTQLVSESGSQTRRPSETSATTENPLKDTVYEQRMADIEAMETKGVTRGTDALHF